MTLALSEVFVVSMAGLPMARRGFHAASYMDLLEANALGRYRNLLGAVTLSPGMGVYLNLRGNQKGDSTTGRQPDENHAREVLQLFSIGLVALAADATALVARIALWLSGDGLDTDTVAVISSAVASISAATDAGKLSRVRAAVHLLLCAPDYLVQV